MMPTKSSRGDINSFAPELLLAIFQHINLGSNLDSKSIAKCCRVSKSWYPAARSVLYSRPSIDRTEECEKFIEALRDVADVRKVVKILNLSADADGGRSALEMMNCCENLKEVYFERVNNDNAKLLIEGIETRCDSLQKISLLGGLYMTCSMDLVSHLHSLSHLTSLSLYGITLPHFSKSEISLLPTPSYRLKSLQLARIRADDRSLRHLFGSSQTSLKSLDVRCLHGGATWPGLLTLIEDFGSSITDFSLAQGSCEHESLVEPLVWSKYSYSIDRLLNAMPVAKSVAVISEKVAINIPIGSAARFPDHLRELTFFVPRKNGKPKIEEIASEDETAHVGSEVVRGPVQGLGRTEIEKQRSAMENEGMAVALSWERALLSIAQEKKDRDGEGSMLKRMVLWHGAWYDWSEKDKLAVLEAGKRAGVKVLVKWCLTIDDDLAWRPDRQYCAHMCGCVY